MVARRLLIIALVLLGLSVLAASLPPPVREQSATGTPAQTEDEPRRKPQTLTLSVDDSRRRVRVDQERPLALEVTSARTGAVQAGDGGPIDVVAPDSPARFDLYPDSPEVIEIALLEPRRVIARIIPRR